MSDENKYWLDVDLYTEEEVKLPKPVTKQDIKEKLEEVLNDLDERGYFKKNAEVDITFRGMTPTLKFKVDVAYPGELIDEK